MDKITINSMSEKSYAVSEAFKSLRTNIQFCGADIKCIALTSCQPNEGKSVISVELALSLADMGKKVVFIDSDMRKSVLTSRYSITSSAKGLSQYLTNQATEEEVICGTQKENLDVILSGVFPPNPVELLSSRKFSELIDSMRAKYDYIIIDTPPLGAVIDAAVIATLCDGVALIIGLQKTSYKLAREVKQQLEKSDCKILGAIANFTESSGNIKGRYGRYGKYSRYSTYGSDENTVQETQLSDNKKTATVSNANKKTSTQTKKK